MDGGMVPVIIGGEVYYKPADEELARAGRDHVGEVLAVSVYLRSRSVVEHKRYRAILRHAVQNLVKPDGCPWFQVTTKREQERAVETLHYLLRRRAGFTRTITHPVTGEEYSEPMTTAFSQAEDKVEAYRGVAYGLLAEWLGCSVRDLVQMGREA